MDTLASSEDDDEEEESSSEEAKLNGSGKLLRKCFKHRPLNDILPLPLLLLFLRIQSAAGKTHVI